MHFLKSHNIFILPYACDSNLSKKKSIIVTTEIFSQFKIDGLKILRQLMINQTIQLMLVVLSKQKSTRNKVIPRSAVFCTGNAACRSWLKPWVIWRVGRIILLKFYHKLTPSYQYHPVTCTNKSRSKIQQKNNVSILELGFTLIHYSQVQDEIMHDFELFN